MPNYVYECLNCVKKLSRPLEELTDEEYESLVLYEARHSMTPTDEELQKACECPRCKSHKAKRVYYGYNVTTYTLGYGFLDKAGATRDMNIFKLEKEDPYAEYRQPGEASDIKDRLQKQGRHNPKTKYYPNKVTEKDVKKVVDKPK